MADVQITCVNKPDRMSPHEHITHVGNPGWLEMDSRAGNSEH